MYLMKIQISFECKKIRYIFNKNTDQFWCVKKIRSIFNGNTDQFWCVLKKSDLKI